MAEQVCTMRIMFPVKDDNEAVEVKKKIEDVLKDTEGAHIQFTLTPTPQR